MSTVELDKSDIEIGLALTTATASAYARAEALAEAEQLFGQALFHKYGVSPETHVLRSWLTGFEPKEVQHDGR